MTTPIDIAMPDRGDRDQIEQQVRQRVIAWYASESDHESVIDQVDFLLADADPEIQRLRALGEAACLLLEEGRRIAGLEHDGVYDHVPLTSVLAAQDDEDGDDDAPPLKCIINEIRYRAIMHAASTPALESYWNRIVVLAQIAHGEDIPGQVQHEMRSAYDRHVERDDRCAQAIRELCHLTGMPDLAGATAVIVGDKENGSLDIVLGQAAGRVWSTATDEMRELHPDIERLADAVPMFAQQMQLALDWTGINVAALLGGAHTPAASPLLQQIEAARMQRQQQQPFSTTQMPAPGGKVP